MNSSDNLPDLKRSLRPSQDDLVAPTVEQKLPMMNAITDNYYSAQDDDFALAGILDPNLAKKDMAGQTSGGWPFAYTLALGLAGSAVLWAATAALIHYFL